MKKTPYALIPILAITLAACGGKTQNEEQQDTIWTRPQATDQILSMMPMQADDQFEVNGTTYNYSYHFQPVDTLPIITNAEGLRYYDNEVNLTIRRDSTVIFRRRFTRNNFTHLVAPRDARNAALVGFSYNLTRTDDHSHFHFIATIGDPDETAGINFPFDIQISTNGNMSIEPAQDIETEPLIQGLNQDPSADGGV